MRGFDIKGPPWLTYGRVGKHLCLFVPVTWKFFSNNHQQTVKVIMVMVQIEKETLEPMNDEESCIGSESTIETQDAQASAISTQSGHKKLRLIPSRRAKEDGEVVPNFDLEEPNNRVRRATKVKAALEKSGFFKIQNDAQEEEWCSFEVALVQRLVEFVWKETGNDDVGEAEREVRKIERAARAAVVHLVRESEVVAKKESSMLKRVVINYAYDFLRRNLREENEVVLIGIPFGRLLKVGMTYEWDRHGQVGGVVVSGHDGDDARSSGVLRDHHRWISGRLSTLGRLPGGAKEDDQGDGDEDDEPGDA
ncbi:putative potassium transporter 16 [Acorus calamus]|uniref:Potassium transporter 16 n=1 Tax=Acorus calamus TaxID=4465 RepID=A0AAV9ER53_ACOCL|nr:putative potassium transporter 16 [Acorus calamus]